MSACPLSASDVAFLREAAAYLENPSYLMKIADLIGQPLQTVAKQVVPKRIADLGNKTLLGAVGAATDTVFTTSGKDTLEEAYSTAGWTGFWHRLVATTTGGIGGAFGFAGLAIELPVTTSILFRSISAIADNFGEDLRKPEIRLECLTVFSYGGPAPTDDSMESTYITARVAMATLVRDAAEFMAKKSASELSKALAKNSAPALITFINRIATQFNVTVSQKFLAQSVPIIGIATGAAINNAFAGHFNSVARFHFGIRKLERKYGKSPVQNEYQQQLKILNRTA